MPDLKIVNQIGDKTRIFFSARVELEKEDGELVQYRIMGADETDTKQGDISIDSPLAKALLKKQIDDEVSIRVAELDVTYVVVSIDYEP